MIRHILILALIKTFHCNAYDIYNIDPDLITISGISSGAAMAMQYHVAFSKQIKGAGILSGVPYACAKNVPDFLQCITHPESIVVPEFVSYMEIHGKAGNIDPPSNLEGQRVFIFHGTEDHRINPQIAPLIKQIYEHFGAVVKMDVGVKAAHGFPTDNYGGRCDVYSPETNYINNCHPYNGAYATLSYLYNDTVRPNNTSLGLFIQFDQTEFGSLGAGMDRLGFYYIPTSCLDKTRRCKLHISLHGCQQYEAIVGDVYATKTGFLEVAEANDIVLVFPQVRNTTENPNGCWEWWPYLDHNFPFKAGKQLQVLNKIVKRMASIVDNNSAATIDKTLSIMFTIFSVVLTSTLS